MSDVIDRTVRVSAFYGDTGSFGDYCCDELQDGGVSVFFENDNPERPLINVTAFVKSGPGKCSREVSAVMTPAEARSLRDAISAALELSSGMEMSHG